MCPQTDKLSVVGRTLKLTKCQSQERPKTDKLSVVGTHLNEEILEKGGFKNGNKNGKRKWR